MDKKYYKTVCFGLMIWTLILSWQLRTTINENDELKSTHKKDLYLLINCTKQQDSLIQQQIHHINKCKTIKATIQ